jgi:hypothetical protein
MSSKQRAGIAVVVSGKFAVVTECFEKQVTRKLKYVVLCHIMSCKVGPHKTAAAMSTRGAFVCSIVAD